MTLASHPYGAPYFDTTSSNGQNIRVYMPGQAVPTRLVLWSHPASQNEQIGPGYFAYPFPVAALNQGWAFAGTREHSDQWGNDTALNDLLDLYTYMTGIMTVSKVVLAGASMGGLPTLLAYLGQTVTIPNVKGAVLIDAVTNLANQYTNASYTASIDTAYGITRGTISGTMGSTGVTSVPTTSSFPTIGTQLLLGNGTANSEIVTTTGASTGTAVAVTATTKTHASADQVSDFPTKTANHDPNVKSAASYAGLRFRLYASSADVTVSKTGNSDAFVTLVTGQAAEVNEIAHPGPHLHQTGMQPRDLTPVLAGVNWLG